MLLNVIRFLSDNDVSNNNYSEIGFLYLTIMFIIFSLLYLIKDIYKNKKLNNKYLVILFIIVIRLLIVAFDYIFNVNYFIRVEFILSLIIFIFGNSIIDLIFKNNNAKEKYKICPNCGNSIKIKSKKCNICEKIFEVE